MADDLGFQPAAQPSDDLGFQPAPKVPDMSGVQKTAQQNLTPEAPKEGDEAKPQEPQSPAQKLDTAFGFQATATMKGANQDTPLPTPMREHLINAYKDGSADTPSSFFQSAMMAVSPVLQVGAAASSIGARFEGTLAYPMLSEENRQKLIDSGTLGNVPTLTGDPTHDMVAKVLTRANALLSPGMGAAYALPASLAAPVLSPALEAANKAAGVGNASNVPAAEELAMNLFGLGGGKFVWDRVQGADTIKSIVAEHLDKPASSVTPSDIDGVIHKGFENVAPKASDFENTAIVLHNTAYHGTPHDFDEFSLQHAGTGEGNQSYGYGAYLAEARNTAEKYRDNLSSPSLDRIKQFYTPGNIVDAYGGKDRVLSFNEEKDGGFNVKVERVKQNSDGDWVVPPGERPRTHSTVPDNNKLVALLGEDAAKHGRLYRTQIPSDDKLLSWEKPISEQPSVVQEGLSKLFTKEELDKFGTGAAAYHALSDKLGGDKAASDALNESGIAGHKYLDQLSRSKGGGTHNYVVYNDKNIDVRQQYYGERPFNKDDLTDSLHNIYKQTGIRPDQVFEDAKRDPEVMAAVQEGRIPANYEAFIDKRPPIPPEIQAILDKSDAAHQARQEGQSGKTPPPLSKEGASTSNNPLAKIFNPTGMSEASKDMATALRQGRGPENRDVAVIQDSMQKYAKTFAKMSDEDRLNFIDYIENRSKEWKIIDNPELQEAADKIRDIYSQVAKKIQENFPDVGLRQDYFTHQYKDPLAAEKFFSDWAAKQGSERNLQARVFPTLSEAMEAGLEPKTTNPIETVMSYVNNMGRLIAANRSVELAQEGGIADYFKSGQQPSGWVPLDGNLAEKGGKALYAPEDAARVYNNDISKGLTKEAGDILDNIQRVNNFTNKLVLGLSGYHFTATTMASMASDVGRAITSGTIPERAADIGRAATAPVSNVITGQKYVDAYLGRSELSPELQKALDLAVKNNTINVKQQDYWKAGPAKDYVDVFKNGSAATELKLAGEAIKQKPITGTVGVIANEIGRTMDTVSKPLFDYYIPRIKIAANINELHDWIQSHPEATPEMQDRAAQEIGNSIDNRFGEMMRDNLFWHQITRQTLQTALLSYSWVTGAARMLKGIPDTAAFIMKGKDLSSSARYLMGMAATYAVVNGTRTYIGTGHAPDNWKDFIYPRTGGTTPQGKEEREILPSHIGQYTNYLHEGIGELGNEMSPGLKLIYHLMANKDWRGLPITNDNNKWYSEQRWDDYLKYTLGEETPIGIKNFLQGNKIGSKISVVEKILGARQANRQTTDPEGYEAMMKHVNDAEYKKKLRSDAHIKQQYENSDAP